MLDALVGNIKSAFGTAYDSHPTPRRPSVAHARSLYLRTLFSRSRPTLPLQQLLPLRDHYSPHALYTLSNTGPRYAATAHCDCLTQTPHCWSLPPLPITNTGASPPHAPATPYTSLLLGRHAVPLILAAAPDGKTHDTHPAPIATPNPVRRGTRRRSSGLSATFSLIVSQSADSVSNFDTFLLLSLSSSSTSAFHPFH
ncbi:hypothetical protein B0H19DRAFT_1263535 [Mycena capillaripes]|nr:hypothetical protein B0H19DRAFT_1263535 [Mycena capillaripes]